MFQTVGFPKIFVFKKCSS